MLAARRATKPRSASSTLSLMGGGSYSISAPPAPPPRARQRGYKEPRELDALPAYALLRTSTHGQEISDMPMRVHNLYTDVHGESHFRDLEIEWVEVRGTRKYSQRLPATGIIFRETGADYDLDWHPAPRRQYIINLDAGVKITASDGESRTIGAGEVILVEDTSGKGHLSQAIGGQIRHSIFVPIE
jgi:hypothetical protein